MKHKLILILFFLLLSLTICSITVVNKNISRSTPSDAYQQTSSIPTIKNNIIIQNEQRGNPSYDSIIGQDGWPHYRVFFWVPKKASNLIPYANAGVNTDVSEHGPAQNWTVLDAGKTKGNLKLVFILVPKTFVYLYGKGFEKVIHLDYKIE